MAKAGRRHRLILYTYMLNRWWKFSLAIGVLLLALALALRLLPAHVPGYRVLAIPDVTFWTVVGAGGYALLLAIFLFSISKSAYVQPFATHLRVITPFLRMNISYRRIMQASSVEMQHLFPIFKYKGFRKRLMRPLAKQTAIVLEMRGWPLPHWVLGLFLSPFFFPDKTSRLALLVPRWMDFSLEMESFRSTWYGSQVAPTSDPQSDLLASLNESRR